MLDGFILVATAIAIVTVAVAVVADPIAVIAIAVAVITVTAAVGLAWGGIFSDLIADESAHCCTTYCTSSATEKGISGYTAKYCPSAYTNLLIA